MTPEISPSVTSVDVAKRAGVSQSAVSRTFTPGASVSAKTKEKVLKAAHDLGYRPNALARAMISGRSRLVAVLVAYMENKLYPSLLDRLSRLLQGRGYQVLLFITDPAKQDPIVQQMLDYRVEAIFVASAKISPSLIKGCAAHGIPTIMLNRYAPMSSASRVVSDNVGGGHAAADLLVRAGHERIAFVAGAEYSSTSKEREAGFRKGLAENRMRVWKRAVGNYNFEAAQAAARELFSGDEKPDAVFVANDHMAFAVMDVIRSEFGLRIPEDVSVVGYGDVPEASWKGYDLTTVHQCTELIAQEAVSVFMEQKAKKTKSRSRRILPAKLVIRSSVRLPADMVRESLRPRQRSLPVIDEAILAPAGFHEQPVEHGSKVRAGGAVAPA
jgi:DNA-binding LacI/PurR family transcriptional regulator